MTADTLSEEMANKLRTLDSSLLMVRSAQVSGNMSFTLFEELFINLEKISLTIYFQSYFKTCVFI